MKKIFLKKWKRNEKMKKDCTGEINIPNPIKSPIKKKFYAFLFKYWDKVMPRIDLACFIAQWNLVYFIDEVSIFN